MPHDILNTMRALREDMRQRLMQVPEYRALMALDRSIDEIGGILQAGILAANVAPPQQAPLELRSSQAPMELRSPQAPMELRPPPAPMEPQQQPARQGGGIASAFAETLAAKMDQRNNARAAASYLPTHRVAEN